MHNLPTYKHGFKMPEGYLDSFETSLQKKLALELASSEATSIETSLQKKNTAKVISIKSMLVIGLSIAACLTIFFWVQKTPKDSIDTLAISEIEAYLYSEHVDFNIDEISNEIQDQDFETNFVDTSISDQILEEYLIETLNNNSLILE